MVMIESDVLLLFEFEEIVVISVVTEFDDNFWFDLINIQQTQTETHILFQNPKVLQSFRILT